MYIDVIDVLIPLLTVAALLFSLYQVLQARKHALHLGEIKNSLSTRFLGVFPSYLSELNRLLERANDSIHICYAYPSHGLFSDHAQWLRGRNIITEQRDRRVEISITCSDQAHRDQLAVAQFRPFMPTWESWKASDSAREKFELFMRDHSSLGPEAVTPEQFFALISKIQDQTLYRDFRGIQVTECSVLITNFFWVVDKKEAIFSIVSLAPGSIAHGFYTTDSRLISAFLELKKQFESSFGTEPVRHDDS